LCEKSPGFKGVEVVVCPAFVYLPMVAAHLKGSEIAWGAQDVSAHECGAHTGDIAASMLKDWSCSRVLVGHSERRVEHAETNEIVAEKFRRVIAAGLQPVLCVGETLAQREQGKTLAVVEEQLQVLLQANWDVNEVVIAYEPVWAIGTGKTATAEQAQQVHAFIRQQVEAHAISARILYGGSVNAGNAQALFAQKDIDGGLIGGASLEAESFIAICKAAALKTI
jgi:triosephosphate isomerase